MHCEKNTDILVEPIPDINILTDIRYIQKNLTAINNPGNIPLYCLRSLVPAKEVPMLFLSSQNTSLDHSDPRLENLTGQDFLADWKTTYDCVLSVRFRAPTRAQKIRRNATESRGGKRPTAVCLSVPFGG